MYVHLETLQTISVGSYRSLSSLECRPGWSVLFGTHTRSPWNCRDRCFSRKAWYSLALR